MSKALNLPVVEVTAEEAGNSGFHLQLMIEERKKKWLRVQTDPTTS